MTDIATFEDLSSLEELDFEHVPACEYRLKPCYKEATWIAKFKPDCGVAWPCEEPHPTTQLVCTGHAEALRAVVPGLYMDIWRCAYCDADVYVLEVRKL